MAIVRGVLRDCICRWNDWNCLSMNISVVSQKEAPPLRNGRGSQIWYLLSRSPDRSILSHQPVYTTSKAPQRQKSGRYTERPRGEPRMEFDAGSNTVARPPTTVLAERRFERVPEGYSRVPVSRRGCVSQNYLPCVLLTPRWQPFEQ